MRQRTARRQQVRRLYTSIAALSRVPGLYLALSIPDTIEGRFESLSLHVALILRRLKALPPPALDVSKDVVDLFFADMDSALRTLGVGDLSVGKKIKILAQAFFGRAKALDTALAVTAPKDVLPATLARNVLGLTETAPDRALLLSAYVRGAATLLDGQTLQDILEAERLFPDPDAQAIDPNALDMRTFPIAPIP